MKKYVLNSWISVQHFPMNKDCIEKYIKAGVYLDFRRIADVSIYPPCRVNWRTNIIIFSCHVLVISFYILKCILSAKVTGKEHL